MKQQQKQLMTNETVNAPTLAQRLAAWQTAQKLTPTAAAARCGLSLATWTRLIAGGNASQQSLAGIERALGERV